MTNENSLGLTSDSSGGTRTKAYHVVSLVAYLVGVPKAMFGRNFLASVYERMEDKEEARTIRCLCCLRNALLKRYKDIEHKIIYELSNLDRMPDIIDPEWLGFLAQKGLPLVKANQRSTAYLKEINAQITEKVNACQGLFPLWIHWNYVRQLFLMPGGTKDSGISKTMKQYQENLNAYPFHCYINWPVQKSDAYAYGKADSEGKGNILLHDQKFLTLLYHIHEDEFTDWQRVVDISQQTKADLNQFIEEHQHIVVVVDCENSDPYRLCAALRNIRECCLRVGGIDSPALTHIRKVILYDDARTVDTWRILGDFLNVPIEHELVERVSDRKSLVDIRMTAGTCKEHYANHADAFLLASSDSDFWGLISALPTADFLVLIERNKYGSRLRETFEENGISYCFMDDFAGNVSDIKVAALKKEAVTCLAEMMQVNIPQLLDELCDRLRLEMTDKEKETFHNMYLKHLRLIEDREGNLSVGFKN